MGWRHPATRIHAGISHITHIKWPDVVVSQMRSRCIVKILSQCLQLQKILHILYWPQTWLYKDTLPIKVKPPHFTTLIMQATRAIARSLPPGLNLKPQKQLRVVNVTPTPPSMTNRNAPVDPDQLAYRLCEVSLKKIQKEARRSEPDIRHVLACSSMQRLAQQDLVQRLDALQSVLDIPAMPLFPGCDELMISEEDEVEMRALETAVSELEIARRRSEVARYICIQQIQDM